MSWRSVWDKINDAVDIDIHVRTDSGTVNATTKGTTGQPSIAARIGDMQIEPVVLVAGVAIVAFALLR